MSRAQLFVARFRAGDPPQFFVRWVFLNPGAGKPRGRWTATWARDRAAVLPEYSIAAAKKLFFEREKLVEAVDYDFLPIGEL
jgi:hypothetical protein